MKNYYEILEVNQNASKEVIEKVYKLLVKKYHPDTQIEEKKNSAEEVLKQINLAYETLSDEKKRREYDEYLNGLKDEQINKLKDENAFLKSQVVTLENKISNMLTIPNTQRSSNFSFQPLQYLKNINYNHSERTTFKPDKTYFKRKFKDLVAIVLTIFIIVFVGFVLWHIPVFHDYCISLYENNSLIRNLINIISNFFVK